MSVTITAEPTCLANHFIFIQACGHYKQDSSLKCEEDLTNGFPTFNKIIYYSVCDACAQESYPQSHLIFYSESSNFISGTSWRLYSISYERGRWSHSIVQGAGNAVKGTRCSLVNCRESAVEIIIPKVIRGTRSFAKRFKNLHTQLGDWQRPIRTHHYDIRTHGSHVE